MATGLIIADSEGRAITAFRCPWQKLARIFARMANYRAAILLAVPKKWPSPTGRPFIEIVCKSPSGKELVVQIVFDLQDFQLVRTLRRFDLDYIADLLTDQLLGHRAVDENLVVHEVFFASTDK